LSFPSNQVHRTDAESEIAPVADERLSLHTFAMTTLQQRHTW